jgi:hypothetical protein
MLKIIGNLKMIRPLVASSSNLLASANLVSSKQQMLVNNNKFHTSVKVLGGGDHEYIVKFIVY